MTLPALLLIPGFIGLFAGYSAGFLGRFLGAGWWWRAFIVGMAFLLPVSGLVGHWRVAELVYRQFPEQAEIFSRFQAQVALLTLFTLSLAFWLGVRRSWWVAALPALFFFICQRILLPPLFTEIRVAELLIMQSGRATNFTFFVSCLGASTGLLGFCWGQRSSRFRVLPSLFNQGPT